MNKNSKAFSLIELVVVLSIISILIAMVAGSASIIRMTKLVNARSLTNDAPVSKIDGLIAWYETSSTDSLIADQTVDKANISEWRDISEHSLLNGYNILTRAKSDSVKYIADGINSLPAIYFDGSNNANLKLANFYKGALDRSTIFFVIQFKEHQNKIFFDGYSTTTSFSADTEKLFIKASTTGVWTSNLANLPKLITDKGHIICSYLSGSNSKFYANNVTDIVGNSTINPGKNPIKGATVGSSYDGTLAFNGMISEIIIYNRPLKKYERKAVMAYLSQKYRIKVKNLDE